MDVLCAMANQQMYGTTLLTLGTGEPNRGSSSLGPFPVESLSLYIISANGSERFHSSQREDVRVQTRPGPVALVPPSLERTNCG